MGDWGRARRRRGLALLARGLLLFWALLQAEGKLAAKKQPAAGSNIVVLITDDQDALLGVRLRARARAEACGRAGRRGAAASCLPSACPTPCSRF